MENDGASLQRRTLPPCQIALTPADLSTPKFRMSVKVFHYPSPISLLFLCYANSALDDIT
jgi:hypothetical protein